MILGGSRVQGVLDRPTNRRTEKLIYSCVSASERKGCSDKITPVIQGTEAGEAKCKVVGATVRRLNFDKDDDDGEEKENVDPQKVNGKEKRIYQVF